LCRARGVGALLHNTKQKEGIRQNQWGETKAEKREAELDKQARTNLGLGLARDFSNDRKQRTKVKRQNTWKTKKGTN
jgi:hypothetical protein